MICPDCGYDELYWKERDVEIWINGEFGGDASEEYLLCAHCEAEWKEDELCKNDCGKAIPMRWVGSSDYCSNECHRLYENGDDRVTPNMGIIKS